MGKTLAHKKLRPLSIETPPRAWGRLCATLSLIVSLRNTPTCMGKTSHLFLHSFELRKHPHVHGEDLVFIAFNYFSTETPPRAWGRQSLPDEWRTTGRNTPTCMGKTSLNNALKFAKEKHPHVHGEDPVLAFSNNPPPETPPRAWGRPSSRALINSAFGNTPTCMGKTSISSKRMHLFQKHPHVHGEDCVWQ